MHRNSKETQLIMIYKFSLNRIKKQYDLMKLRCLEQEQRIQQLVSLLNDKQIFIDNLHAEKR